MTYFPSLPQSTGFSERALAQVKSSNERDLPKKTSLAERAREISACEDAHHDEHSLKIEVPSCCERAAKVAVDQFHRYQRGWNAEEMIKPSTYDDLKSWDSIRASEAGPSSLTSSVSEFSPKKKMYLAGNWMELSGAAEKIYVGSYPLTMSSFWQHITQTRTNIVVQLSQEGVNYHIRREDVYFKSGYFITLSEERVEGCLCIRSYQLTSDCDSFSCEHLSMEWPDHLLPPESNFDQLMDSYRSIVARRGAEEPQAFVHCKAGVGRSGTFLYSRALELIDFPLTRRGARALLGKLRHQRFIIENTEQEELAIRSAYKRNPFINPAIQEMEAQIGEKGEGFILPNGMGVRAAFGSNYGWVNPDSPISTTPKTGEYSINSSPPLNRTSSGFPESSDCSSYLIDSGSRAVLEGEMVPSPVETHWIAAFDRSSPPLIRSKSPDMKALLIRALNKEKPPLMTERATWCRVALVFDASDLLIANP